MTNIIVFLCQAGPEKDEKIRGDQMLSRTLQQMKLNKANE